jgi:hypothetical protein
MFEALEGHSNSTTVTPERLVQQAALVYEMVKIGSAVPNQDTRLKAMGYIASRAQAAYEAGYVTEEYFSDALSAADELLAEKVSHFKELVVILDGAVDGEMSVHTTHLVLETLQGDGKTK